MSEIFRSKCHLGPRTWPFVRPYTSAPACKYSVLIAQVHVSRFRWQTEFDSSNGMCDWIETKNASKRHRSFEFQRGKETCLKYNYTNSFLFPLFVVLGSSAVSSSLSLALAPTLLASSTPNAICVCASASMCCCLLSCSCDTFAFPWVPLSIRASLRLTCSHVSVFVIPRSDIRAHPAQDTQQTHKVWTKHKNEHKILFHSQCDASQTFAPPPPFDDSLQ